MENIDFAPAIFWAAVFATAVYLFVEVLVRRPAEKVWPALRTNLWWKAALIQLPLVVGALGALALPGYPYPIENPSAEVRALLGFFAGGFSSFAYHFLKTLFRAFAARQVAAVGGKSEDPAGPPSEE